MSRTVAIVEDDAGILDLVREVLEIDGFQVAMFDAPDILKMVEMEPAPALFLIDLMLPGMTGVELAAHLRASASYLTTKDIGDDEQTSLSDRVRLARNPRANGD